MLDGADSVFDFIQAILFLDARCEKSVALITRNCAFRFIREAKVINLILLKACDKCALTFIQYELGDELADAKHVNEFDDVDLL